ncbi:hypothetical protein BZA77DRAFT_299112 [Pyronema omphalodes]|nr:hypothetical protein BZA77DRAFT_299112 [Pyronema omphalodes]
MSWRSHKVDIGETTGEITEGVTEDFTKVLQEDVTAVTEYTQNPLGSPGSAQQASQVEKYTEIATGVEVSKEVASSAKTDAVMEEEEVVDKEPMEEDPSVTQSTATTNAPTTTPVLTADLATELDFAMLQTPPRSPPESASQSQADTLTLLAAISDSQIPSSIPRSSGVSAVPDSSGSKPVEPQLSPRPHPRRIRVPGYSTFTAEQQAELESRRAQWFGIQRGERPRIRGIGEQIAVNQKFWAEVAERKEARNMQNNTQRREELEWYKDENTPFKKFVRNWERLKAVRMEREKAMEAIRKEEEARKTA